MKMEAPEQVRVVTAPVVTPLMKIGHTLNEKREAVKARYGETLILYTETFIIGVAAIHIYEWFRKKGLVEIVSEVDRDIENDAKFFNFIIPKPKEVTKAIDKLPDKMDKITK